MKKLKNKHQVPVKHEVLVYFIRLKCIKQTWHVTICDRSTVNMRQEEEWDQAQFWHHVDCSLVSVVKSCNIDEMRPRVSAALVITSICISVGCYARLQTVEAPDYKQNFSSHHSLVKDYYCSWFHYWPWSSLVVYTELSPTEINPASVNLSYWVPSQLCQLNFQLPNQNKKKTGYSLLEWTNEK